MIKTLLAAGANGGGLLREASEEDHVKVVWLLLATGVDVNAKGKYGKTPFYFAVRKDETEVAEILRDAMKKRKLK